MIRKVYFFLLSALVHGLLLLPILILPPSTKFETVIIQVQFRSGGNSRPTSGSKVSHSNPISRKASAPTGQTANSVTNSSGEESDQGSSQGPTILGSDLGIIAAYPRMSRVLGEVGKVLVEVTQTSNQAVSKIQVSSGFPRLDESALKATQIALGQGLLSSYLKEKKQIQLSFLFRLVEHKKETN